MVNKTFKSVLCLTIFLINFSSFAHDASKVWEQAYKSTLIVLPTWPGYNKPGFGAPAGTAPAPNLSIDFKKAVSEPSNIGAGFVIVVVVDIML